MLQTPPGSRSTSPVPINTPVHRASRRIRGLPPEVDGTLPTISTGMASASVQTIQTGVENAASNRYTLESPRVPTTFRGAVFEDVEDWLVDFERVAALNQWDNPAKLRHVYFYLEDGARTWFQNREEQLTSWPEFCRCILEAYISADRHERAERAIQARVQLPNETVTAYVEDMTRLFRRADPRMAEDKKLRHLMRGVKEQLFAGLVRSPPKTVAEFLAEAVTMEKMLLQRSNLYERQVSSMSTADIFTGIGSSTDYLRELIRSIVREELQKCAATPSPTVNSVANVIKEELHQVLREQRDTLPRQNTPQAPADYPRASYAEALSRPASPPPQFTRVPPTVALQPAQPMPYYGTFVHAAPVAYRSEQAVQYIDDRRMPPRKSDVWRTPDRRPLCYHCGEADHLYRHCPYRRLGLRGFSAYSPPPRYGQRPRDIEDYLSQQHHQPPAGRQSRSPSPRRFSSPPQRYPTARSPSPRREN